MPASPTLLTGSGGAVSVSLCRASFLPPICNDTSAARRSSSPPIPLGSCRRSNDECRVPVNNQLVVTRTRDGGKSFEVLRTGLPQQHSYDLVYRHGLTIDATGNSLAFGSTTGNLWVSDNQGDSWQLVSSYLPPIYSVRFDD